MGNLGLLNIIESVVLTENRVDDAKKLGEKLGVNLSDLDYLINQSESVNSNHKYTNWLISRYNQSGLFVSQNKEQLEKIVSDLRFFDKHTQNFPKKDINQYKSFEELDTAIESAELKERRKIEIVPGTKVIFEDRLCLILVPETQKSSCYYGAGTKWCTATEGSTHFNSYKQKGELYYVISKTLSSKDPHYKMAISVVFNDGKWPPKPKIDSLYDAQDKSITSNVFTKYATKTAIDVITKDFKSKFDAWWKKNKLSLTKAHEEYLIKNAEEIKRREEQDRIQNERERARRLERQNETQSRREDGEYDNYEKVHALRQYLIESGEWEGRDDESEEEHQRISGEIQQINDVIEELNEKKIIYQQKKNTKQIVKIDARLTELNGKIDELQEQLDELPTGDIYDLYKESYDHYGLDHFTYEPNDHEYAIGDDDEADKAAYEYVESLIDEIGFEGFNEGFIDSYIDGDAVANWADADGMVRDSPSSYIRDDADLTEDAQNEINEKRSEIDSLNEKLDEIEDEDERTEIEDRIQELEDEISDIEDDDENKAYSEEQIEEAIKDYEDDIRRDPMDYLKGLGMTDSKTIKQFIDEDELIKGIIESDGRANGMAGYDGHENSVDYNGTTYYIYRTN